MRIEVCKYKPRGARMAKQKKEENQTNQTFAELIRRLTDDEEVGSNMSDDEYEVLVGNVVDKVDALRTVMSKMEAEAERLCKIKKEFELAQRQVEKNYERLKSYIIHVMSSNNQISLQGEKFKLSYVKCEQIAVIDRPPTEDEYFRIAAKWPQAVRRTLEWDKNAIKRIAKESDPEELKGLWYDTHSKTIKWRANKNV
jgi:hypothetical protein